MAFQLENLINIYPSRFSHELKKGVYEQVAEEGFLHLQSESGEPEIRQSKLQDTLQSESFDVLLPARLILVMENF